MVVAEVDAYFSRAVAPTRRVAVGEFRWSGEATTESAAMLLGGIAARFARSLDPDDTAEYHRLLTDLEIGRRIPQPRLRHRFQVDRIGLQRCTHALVASRDGQLHLHLDDSRGTPEQHALACAYLARGLPPHARKVVVEAVRRGLNWRGDLGPALLGVLRLGIAGGALGAGASAADPVGWAMATLGLTTIDGRPGTAEVRRAFRSALRDAHPDHGADFAGAAERISELDAARRILLG